MFNKKVLLEKEINKKAPNKEAPNKEARNKKEISKKILNKKVLNEKLKFFLTLFFIVFLVQFMSQDLFAMQTCKNLEKKSKVWQDKDINQDKKDINTVTANGWPKLCLLCYANKKKKVKKMIQELVQKGQIEGLNKTNINGEAPLYLSCMHACIDSDIELMEDLLQNGADPKKANMAHGSSGLPTMLSLACDKENFDIFDFLVKKGVDKNDINAFCRACEKNNLKFVECFFDKNIDIDSQNCICVKESKFVDINEYDNNGQLPICIACKDGNFDLVKFLIKHGVDLNKPNKLGQTPLCIACRNNDLQMVKLLLASGASTGKLNKPYYGSALFFAHKIGNLEIIDCLIKQGIDVKFELYQACCSDSLEFVQYIVEKFGVNVDQTFYDGLTSMNLAIKNDCLRVACYLYKMGVKIDEKSKQLALGKNRVEAFIGLVAEPDLQ